MNRVVVMTLLVLVNTDAEKTQPFEMSIAVFRDLGKPSFDLVSNKSFTKDLSSLFLAPGESLCLSPSSVPAGLAGTEYRISRAQAAWAMKCLSQTRAAEEIGPFDWRELARRVAAGPQQFLSSLSVVNPQVLKTDVIRALDEAAAAGAFPNVITWELIDARRITPIPPGHWLLVSDLSPFRATVSTADKIMHLQSIACGRTAPSILIQSVGACA